MKINDFKLERYFAKHEFTAKYLLSSSDCDAFSLQYILDRASNKELAEWEKLNFAYTESQGNPLLRESISRFYQTKSIERIVVASPGELNFIAMNVLLKSSDHVITISPCYQSLSEVVRSIGCEISYWKPEPENWKFNPEQLESLVQKNTKLIIINFPHNPTGSYLSQYELNQVIDIARKNNLYLFSDEMYHKLVIGEMEELQPICDLYEKGISLWGTSKSFGLAGLRIGWIVSQDTEIINKTVAFKDYLSICNSAPSEILSWIALNHSEQFIDPNISKIRNNIKLFEDFAIKHSGFFRFVAPQAGSTAFVQINIKESALDFSNKLVEQTGIMTVPAEMFGIDEKYIRIGFGRKNLPETLNVFNDYLIGLI